MTPVPQSQNPQMSENDLLKCVLDLAKVYGWRSYHARPAMTAKGYRTPVQGDGKGFPDLVLVRTAELIAVELKSEKGRLTDDQQAWIDTLWSSQTPAYIWRPSDWADGSILRTLSGAKKPKENT